MHSDKLCFARFATGAQAELANDRLIYKDVLIYCTSQVTQATVVDVDFINLYAKYASLLP